VQTAPALDRGAAAAPLEQQRSELRQQDLLGVRGLLAPPQGPSQARQDASRHPSVEVPGLEVSQCPLDDLPGAGGRHDAVLHPGRELLALFGQADVQDLAAADSTSPEPLPNDASARRLGITRDSAYPVLFRCRNKAG
jgi:hypothetical protein